MKETSVVWCLSLTTHECVAYERARPLKRPEGAACGRMEFFAEHLLAVGAVG